MKTLLTFMIMSGILGGCFRIPPLSLKHETLRSNDFRLDGFYFGSFEEDDSRYTHVFIFFQNGIILTQDSNLRSTADEWKVYFENDKNHQLLRAAPYWWGAYGLNGRLLEIEKWISADYAYPTLEISGRILNDTTILLGRKSLKGPWKQSQSSILEIRKLGECADTLRFVKLETKPDSVNKWIR